MAIIMIQRISKCFDKNFDEVVIGISIIAIGFFLFLDHSYFTWPPQLQSLMNNKCSDTFFIILGLAFLFCAMLDNKFKLLTNITIIVSGSITFLLMTEHVWHVLFAHKAEMMMAVIFDAVLFILIIRCAYKS